MTSAKTDYRKPKIFNDFGLNNNIGLTTYLVGKHTCEEILQPTGKGSLDFIAAAPIPPNPSELLLDNKFGALIAWLRERYDYIVMDTPPVALIADAFELMRFSDANIYVMRQNYTRRQVLTFVDNLHRTNQFPKGSIVLNDFMHELASGYGYGYYEEEAPMKKPFWKKFLPKQK
jgi:capsular exopolysaccharide synthesis family protein